MAKDRDLENHNKGQADGSKDSEDIGVAGGIGDLLLGIGTFGAARLGDSSYDPPSGSDEKKSYDEGFRNARNQK